MTVIQVVLWCAILTSALDVALGAATEEQMFSAAKLMRDVCLPKFPKVSVEVANNINKGIIPDNKDVKCYINCVMEMMQTIKKGKFLYESSLKQVELLMPDDYKEEYTKGLTDCKNCADGIKNHCDAAYALIKCLSVAIPRFMFP